MTISTGISGPSRASRNGPRALRAAIALGVALSGGLAMRPAHADWEYTKWGMTPEQVARASRGAVQAIPAAQRTRIPEVKLESGAEGTFSDGALRLQVGFSFDIPGGGLAMVQYAVLNAEQSGQLKEWMVRRYGQPQSVSGVPAIGMEILNWTTGDEISLHLMTGDRAFVMHSPHGQTAN
jgi:hypothetical protein